MDEESQQKVTMAATGAATIVAMSSVAYYLWSRNTTKANKITSDLTKVPSLSRESSMSLEGDDDCMPRIYVYFGSQTGTAQAFARQLEREGRDHGFEMHVVDLQNTKLQDLVRKDRINSKSGTAVAIFITSTYGEGEAPDNAVNFAKELEQSLNAVDTNMIAGLDFGVFGLGNKQYDHFNAMAKLVDSTLDQIGGNKIVEAGMGDDDSDLEGDFENWKDNHLWPKLKSLYLNDCDVTQSIQSPALPESKYTVTYVQNDFQAELTSQEAINGPFRPFLTAVECSVTEVRELRSVEDTGSTVHVEIDISGQDKLKYLTADNLGVFPQNDASVVESVGKRLGFNLEQVITLQAASGQEYQGEILSKPISIRECLTNYCDLTSAPRRPDMKVLAAFAQATEDQEQLLHMSSTEGKIEFQKRILDQYAGLADVLVMFPSISMSLESFLTICRQMQPRYYTISSSSSKHPNSIHLTVTVNTATRQDGTIFHGHCSNYIATCTPGNSTLRVCVRPSTFRLPEDSTRPIVLIGPGTGIAPMRALVQERSYQRHVEQRTVGSNVLYFGCKKESQDYLYQNEIIHYQETGDLDQLHVAFSRASANEKLYVQHLLAKNGAETFQLLTQDSGAYVYVCGACKMGSDVSDTLKSILMDYGDMDANSAKQYLTQMAHEGRYVQELWA